MSSQDSRGTSSKKLSNVDDDSQLSPQPLPYPYSVPPPPPLAHHPQAHQAYYNYLAAWQQWVQTQQYLPMPSNFHPPPILPPSARPVYPFGALPLRPGNSGFNAQAQPFKPGGDDALALSAQSKSKKSDVEKPPLPEKIPNTPAPPRTTTNAFDPSTTANSNAPISTPGITEEGRKKKHGEPKIMVPAPKPLAEYLVQAMREPRVVTPTDQKLVILDLNGTLLYRPNRKQPTKMIGRPFLNEFLKYLFSNFAVMVWSSAKPQNVKVLVENGLGDFQQQLVGRWARNSFGLSEKLYNKNVQVYKNLELVWASSDIQSKMEGYEQGKRFDQRNTILIDDTSLKAAAQPFNLIEIPEFFGQPTEQDVLCEVAGYLELLKTQEDVSKFIFQTKFKADGTWASEWHDLLKSIHRSKPESSALTPVVVGE